MKELPLSKGKVALVDDDDYPLLVTKKWHVRNCKGHLYAAHTECTPMTNGERATSKLYMHRFLLHPLYKMQVDHIDGNGLNNQRSNLRVVTHRQNAQNIRKPKSSIYPGVVKIKTKYGLRWKSGLNYNGRWVPVGTFKLEIDAFAAYRVACKVLTGNDFA